MKVKSLYPIIVSDNPERTIRFYKSLGFDLKHDAYTPAKNHIYVLSNGDMEIEIDELTDDGLLPMTPGLYGFRMNVDDIDNAYSELKENGWKIVLPPTEIGVGKGMAIQDDQGVNINLIKHI